MKSKKWIPNVFSLGNYFLGFLSIIFASRGLFEYATFSILLATILDLLDGRIARKMGSASPIGKYLDSFADLTTFGVAPGYLLYSIIFSSVNIYGGILSNLWLLGASLAFLYPLCAVIRLARFNSKEYSNFFTGLPTTISGGMIAIIMSFSQIPSIFTFLNIDFLKTIDKYQLPWFIILVFFIIFAFLMISNFKYPKANAGFLSFSKTNSTWKNIGNIIFITAIIFILKYILLILGLIYILKPIFKKILKIEEQDDNTVKV